MMPCGAIIPHLAQDNNTAMASPTRPSESSDAGSGPSITSLITTTTSTTTIDTIARSLESQGSPILPPPPRHPSPSRSRGSSKSGSPNQPSSPRQGSTSVVYSFQPSSPLSHDRHSALISPSSPRQRESPRNLSPVLPSSPRSIDSSASDSLTRSGSGRSRKTSNVITPTSPLFKENIGASPVKLDSPRNSQVSGSDFLSQELQSSNLSKSQITTPVLTPTKSEVSNVNINPKSPTLKDSFISSEGSSKSFPPQHSHSGNEQSKQSCSQRSKGPSSDEVSFKLPSSSLSPSKIKVSLPSKIKQPSSPLLKEPNNKVVAVVEPYNTKTDSNKSPVGSISSVKSNVSVNSFEQVRKASQDSSVHKNDVHFFPVQESSVRSHAVPVTLKSPVTTVEDHKRKTDTTTTSGTSNVKVTFANTTKVSDIEIDNSLSVTSSSSSIQINPPVTSISDVKSVTVVSSCDQSNDANRHNVSSTIPTTNSREVSSTCIVSTSGSSVAPISVISSGDVGTENVTTTTAATSVVKTKTTSFAKVQRPPHNHRLTRQHSLAAFLGLFKSNNNREDSRASAVSAMEEWVVAVREEPEDLERSSGSNNSRSHSIPSTSMPQFVHHEPRRARRSSYHTEMIDLDTAEIAPLVAPPVMAIKKKPVGTAPIKIDTRRCSLTLPYANLYGSWQTTISAPGSRHGSSDTSVGQLPVRRSTVQVEMTNFTNEKLTNCPNNVTQPSQTPGPQSPIVPQAISDAMKPSMSTVPLISSGFCCNRTHHRPFNLIACSLQKVPMKDFGSEVRATMDIVHFLQTAVLLLDVQETSLEGLADSLLEKMLAQEEPLCTVFEAKSILFTHDTCKYNSFFLFLDIRDNLLISI